MIFKNLNKNDVGMVYLSSVRYLLTQKDNEQDMSLMLSHLKNNFLYYTDRDFKCILEDLVDYYRTWKDFSYDLKNDDVINNFSKFVFCNFIVRKLKDVNYDIKKINSFLLNEILWDLNCCYHFREIEEKLGSFVKEFLENESVNIMLISLIEIYSNNTNGFVEFVCSKEELNTLSLNAVYYGVGRRTYVTSIIPNFIKDVMDNIDSETLTTIVSYILSQKEKSTKEINYLGDSCDERSWLNLSDCIKKKLIE